jgi:hypothetical protein
VHGPAVSTRKSVTTVDAASRSGSLYSIDGEGEGSKSPQPGALLPPPHLGQLLGKLPDAAPAGKLPQLREKLAALVAEVKLGEGAAAEGAAAEGAAAEWVASEATAAEGAGAAAGATGLRRTKAQVCRIQHFAKMPKFRQAVHL